MKKETLSNGRTVLIIGGGGYVGIPVSEGLLAKGYSVKCYDNFIYKHNKAVISLLNHPRYDLVVGDVRDEQTLKTATRDVTDVILLAGLVGDPITKQHPILSKSINQEAIINCIDLISKLQIDRFIFVSTCSNYGLIPNDKLADETFTLKPLSLYAEAKVNAEQYILNKKPFNYCTPTILRFATAFGLSKRMRFDLTVNEFCRDLVLGKELTIFDADTWRPYCHVEDFASLIESVFVAPKELVNYEVFNAGGDINNRTKQGIIDSLKVFIPSAKIKYKEKGSDPRNYKVNFTKVKEILGFQPKFTVEMGMKEIISAVHSGMFENLDTNINQYGNYDLTGVK